MIAHIFMTIEKAKYQFSRRMVPELCTKRYSDMTILHDGKIIEIYMVEDMNSIKDLEFTNAYFEEGGTFDEKFIYAVQSRIRII